LSLLCAHNLVDVANLSRDDRAAFDPVLTAFLDTFYLDGNDVAARQARLDPEPEPTPFPEINAWLGAVGEHLAQRWDLEVPRWPEKQEFMGTGRPRFYPADPDLRPILIVESPPAFRRRLLFTRVEPLMTARFPFERQAKMPFGYDDGDELHISMVGASRA
jgi:hypothetical protein